MKQRSRGKGILYLGPVYSSKTNRVISTFNDNVDENNPGIVFKRDMDNRYGGTEQVISHNKLSVKACIVKDASEILEKSKNYSIVAIDELQFFEGIDIIIEKLISEKKFIIGSGLNCDYRRKPFDTISKCIPHMKVKYCHGKCKNCGRKSQYSGRVINGKLIKDGDLIIKSDKDSYVPLCSACWYIL